MKLPRRFPVCTRPSPDSLVARQFFILWSLGGVFCAWSATASAAGELEDKLAAICKRHDVPGIIAASVGPDGIIEAAVTGIRKRGASDTITRDDQFALGSNSKSLTATLAATLVDEGVIEWSTTISDVWPKQSIHEGFKQVTLEQLLAHTGGIQRDLPNGREWSSFFNEKSKPEVERTRMCRLLFAKAPAGTIGKHDYSNLGYVIAAAMLEERGKSTFEVMMKQRVFEKLGMSTTEFYSAATLKGAKGLIWGHSLHDNKPIKPGDVGSENPTVYASCGTIRTTLDDWAKYIQWHMNEVAAPVLKSNETLRHLHEGVADRGAPGQTYGYGWICFQSGFGRTLQHAGNNTNQFSLVWVMPDAKRATIVMTNTGQKQAFDACDAATLVLMQSPAFKSKE